MEDHLLVVLPDLSPELAGAPARAGLSALASRLPPCPAGGFEISLSPRTDRVDFHVLADRWTVRTWAVGADRPGWGGVVSFTTAWTAEDCSFASSVAALVLEFDVDHAAPAVQAPCAFCSFHPAAGEQPGVVRSVAAHLLGEPTFDRLAPALDACLAALPSGAGVNHVGAMWSRPDPYARINIGGLAPDLIAPVASRLGWRGDSGALARIADGLGAVVDSIELAWDLGQEAPRSLGLECFVSDTGDPATPRWPVVL
ncbi:MAG TPA: hypothetical protein PLH72_10715, partial [Vicinamibacterales bacterium]|nr:hypothetical protein [Vicinamibacterales bacterium]